MHLIWPADSWLYWLAVGAVVIGLGVMARRQAAAGPGRGRRGAIAIAVFAAASVVVGMVPSVMLLVLMGVLQREVSPQEAVWWSGALLLQLAAVGVAMWALIGDRSRGRRRCGRCWYDMSATPGLTCPECGRTARTEKGLFRTRRRWRWAFAAALTVVIAVGTAVVPRLRDGTWVNYVPRVALAAAMPWLEDGGRLQGRLAEFCYPDEAWDSGWRRELVASRARSSLRRDNRPVLVRFAIAILRPGEIDGPTAERLVELMESGPPLVKQQALRVGAGLLPRPEDIIPPALIALDDPRTPTRSAALNAFINLGWTQGITIDPPPRLIEACTADGDPELRGQAMVALGGMRPTEEVLALLTAALADPQPPVRAGAVRALAMLDPDRDRAGAMLLRMALDADSYVVGAAIEGLAKSGPYSDEALKTIAAALDVMNQRPAWEFGASIVTHLMKAPIPLETRLELLGHAYANPWLAGFTRDALTNLGPELPEAMAIITRQGPDDPTSDTPAARWRRIAENWITAAMKAQERRAGDDRGG